MNNNDMHAKICVRGKSPKKDTNSRLQGMRASLLKSYKDTVTRSSIPHILEGTKGGKRFKTSVGCKIGRQQVRGQVGHLEGSPATLRGSTEKRLACPDVGLNAELHDLHPTTKSGTSE